MNEKHYAVFAMYPSGLATSNGYKTKQGAGCAKYHKLRGKDIRARVYGKPIAVKIVECTRETFDNKFDEFYNKYNPEPVKW